MSKAGIGRFFVALIATSFVSTGIASAQSQVVQPPAKEQSTQQSTNQIAGASEQKPVDKQPAKEQKAAADNEVEAQPLVVPPAPVIVKKSTGTIAIPADLAAGSGAKTNTGSKYEARPSIFATVSVGSSFGYRRDPFTRRAKFHSGVDLKARWGDAVGASQAGTVTFAGWHHGYGNMVIVDHGGGVTTHYAHLSSFDVEPGAHVERGTIIGRAGSTGRATSPHLHYEVRIDGAAMDPLQPLALDPSSDYFKQTRPTLDAGRVDAASTAASLPNK